MDANYLKRSFICLGTITLVLVAPLFAQQWFNPADNVAYAARLSTLKERPPWAPLPGERPFYKYHYYPEAQVYFDPGRSIFFFRDRGEWIESHALPGDLRSELGEFVIVEMSTARPYWFHSQVIQYYPVPYRYSEETSRSSPESTPAPAPNVTYRYYYYPHSQVFFDPDTHNYFYFLHRRWLKSTRLPYEIGPLDEDYVIIETDTDIPYTYHSQVLYMLSNERKSVSKAALPPPLWEPRGNDPVYHYLYYPDAFVYFDDDRGIYFYYSDEQWRESPALPSYLTRQLGEPVRLSMNTSRPYQHHSDVLDRYPAHAAKTTESRPTFQIWSRTR